jgi:hypothetical protein
VLPATGLAVDVAGPGECFGFVGHPLRLIRAALRAERLRKRAGGVKEISPLARRTEHFVRLAQAALRSCRIPSDQLNLTSRDPTQLPTRSSPKPLYIEPFSSVDLGGLKGVDGFGELSGAPATAVEFAEDAPGLDAMKERASRSS